MSKQLTSYKIALNLAGVTDAQVATELGIAEATVTAWFDGSIPCSADNAARVRRAAINLGGGPYLGGKSA